MKVFIYQNSTRMDLNLHDRDDTAMQLLIKKGN